MDVTRPGQAGIPLLLIEDDERISAHLARGLEDHGYDVLRALSAAAGLTSSASSSPEVALVDLGLPDIEGTEVVRVLRERHPAALIIIITARSDDMDVVMGLDAGADDYLVKPFTVTVLLARLRAHLRRRPPQDTPAPLMQVGTLSVDPQARTCLVGEQAVDLRPKEFDLLVALAYRAGRAVSRERLMAQVWDENWFGSTKTLDVTMAALRRRIEDAEQRQGGIGTPVRISTLRGFGYRLEVPAGVAAES
jgi:DNA-binding response OmpR family regulator